MGAAWVRAIGCAGLLALGAAGCANGTDDESSSEVATDSGAATSSEQTSGTTPSSTAAPGEVRYLFVQSAESAGFRGSDAEDAGVLELTDVSSVTFAFTEEPFRDTGAVPTTQFVSSFAERFPGASPNAVVSSVDAPVGEFPVELGAPTLSDDGRTVAYPVTSLIPEQPLPDAMGPVSVFIDPEVQASPITVEGTVTDVETGESLSFADVILASSVSAACQHRGEIIRDDQLSRVVGTESDFDGSFSLSAHLASGATYYVVASMEGYQSWCQAVQLRQSTTNVDIALEPTDMYEG